MIQASTNNVNKQIHAEEVRSLYATQPPSLVANLVISILFAIAQQGYIENNILLTWAGMVITVTILRFILYFNFKRQSQNNDDLEHWGTYFNIGSSSTAFISGMAGIFLFPADNSFHQMFCTFVLVGMSAASMPTLSITRITYPIYITFLLLPVIINYSFQGVYLTQVMPVMIFAVYLFLLLSGRRVYLNNTNNTRLRLNAVNNEQQLILAQKKQQLYTNMTPLAVIEWTTDFTVKEWNPAAEKIFGYSREQAIGKHAKDLIITDNVKEMADKIWQSLLTLSGGEVLINENIRSDGRVITCEWHNTPLIDSNNEIIAVVSIAHDITHRIKAEKEIYEAKNMLQTILNTIPVRVFWKDKNKKYLGCNTLFAGDAGLTSAEDIIGKDDFDMPWKEHAKAYQDDDQYVIKNNQSRIAYEEPLTQIDGNTVWVETSKVPLKNSSGIIYGMLGTYHDITERKQYESRILTAKEEAEHANNAKSEFMSRMSHELRTPMNAILGFAQLLIMEQDTLSNDHFENAKEINNAGQQLLTMINQVLEISTISSTQMTLQIEDVNINDLISGAIQIFQSQIIEKNIKLHFSPECEIYIKADRQRLQQVLINIISNSIKFNKMNGEIFINLDATKQGFVRIQIKDTGIGIKPDEQPRIFEAFRRTDKFGSEFDGAGIGLTVVEKLLELMHATIKVESEYGHGTLIEITLPEKPQTESVTSH